MRYTPLIHASVFGLFLSILFSKLCWNAPLKSFLVQGMLLSGAQVIADSTWMLLREGSTYLHQLGILEQGSVNVELSHVIDDDSTANTLLVSRWRSSMVLPAPRKPLMSVTGSLALPPSCGPAQRNVSPLELARPALRPL